MFLNLWIQKIKRRFFFKSYEKIMQIFGRTIDELEEYEMQMRRDSDDLRAEIESLVMSEQAALKEMDRAGRTLDRLKVIYYPEESPYE